jgi:DNA-binding transcriptional LysR family regulator
MTISRLDLNLLRVLEMVLAERSVARAARRLHVTPSAISNALARLRVALGDPLVVRHGRGIVPTPRAASLEPVLKRLLEELGQAVQDEAGSAATTTRRFTLAIADAGQLILGPRLAAAFSKAMPRARLSVVGIDTLLSTGGLAGAEVDLAVAGLDVRQPAIHAQPLYTEQAVLVARRRHPLSRGAISKRALSGVRHVDVQVAPGRGYRGLDAAYAQSGLERSVALVVPSFTSAATIAAATDYVATLPESFVKRFGAAFGIAGLRAPVPRVAVDIQLAWHERTEHDPLMKMFRDLVGRVVREARHA